MSEFIDQVAQVVTVGSVLSSALLGILIGAFYGYYLAPERPPMFPVALLLVGVAFIAVFQLWSSLANAPFQPPFSLGRAILWVVTVSAIPIGRYGRHLIDIRRHRRSRQRVLDSLR